MTRATDPDWPPKGLSKPAQRALANAGIGSYAQLAAQREASLAGLHGMGRNGLRTLKDALAARGLRFSA